MYSSKFYYEILFDENAHVCWGNTAYSTVTQNVEGRFEFGDVHQYVSINSFKPGSTRRDDNVDSYRNILLEFDTGTIEEQKKLIRDLNIPFSTMVYSGSKSLHVVISLEMPLKTKMEYDQLVRRIYAKVPQADQSGKNCSRFTRAPNALRHNSKQKQDFLAYRYRIPLTQLETWLGPELKTEQQPIIKEHNEQKILKGSTWYFLQNGAPTGQWNRSLFLAAIDMMRSGYTEDRILAHLFSITGSLDRADKRTIQSAFNVVKKEKADKCE